MNRRSASTRPSSGPWPSTSPKSSQRPKPPRGRASNRIPTLSASDTEERSTERSDSMTNLKGKRVAVLVEKLYEDLELWYPVLRLREAGCAVKIVGPKAGESYASKHGYPAKAD